ncbi:MAG TPA: hypothetical protein VHX87_09910 [Galbitalea sp.]|jgi:hypothetical protein|nr:hypothetical protein [Galbitalea sp.]
MVATRQAPAESATNGGTPRARRRVWFDPRFAIGLILVVISVLGVVGLVGAVNASVDVLAARSPLSPGERVHVSDLVPTSIRVGRTAQLYLRGSEVPSAGVIVTRTVAAGELIPHSAIGSEAGANLTSIVVATPSALPGSVAPGSRVDLWAAVPASDQADDGSGDNSDGAGSSDSGSAPADGGAGAFAPPYVIVSSAIVVRIVDEKQLVASTGSSVELLLPKADVAAVLDAVANGAILSVVPVDVPLGQ